jgi:hypothetical protein
MKILEHLNIYGGIPLNKIGGENRLKCIDLSDMLIYSPAGEPESP